MACTSVILLCALPVGAWSMIVNSTSRAKPQLSLTFSSLLSRGDTAAIAVDSDIGALSLAVHDVLLGEAGNDSRTMFDFNASAPEDGTILDFMNGRRFQHQRFFDETVCFQMDLPLDVNFTAPSEEESVMQHFAFKGALGDVLGVPLQLYDSSSEFLGDDNLTGGECGVWMSQLQQLLPFNPQLALPATEDLLAHPLMQFGNGTAR
eukprot:2988066-Amphidinium_carterae.1